MPDDPRPPCAAILGCAGQRLSDAERRFFAERDPIGFILFARNCETPDQVRALVRSLRDCVGRSDAPVLIDQEGGRVARLRPPHWRAYPPARRFGLLAERSREAAREAAELNFELIGLALAALGITVDCVPVLDLFLPETHEVIGDRAFSGDPETVAMLGRAAADGLSRAGVLPVTKHMPGHGRATADSHHHLPRVGVPRRVLEAEDFVPFARLADLPLAMTAHVVYEDLDPELPATISPTIIDEVIRGAMGFDGLLLTDDLSMAALSGELGERTVRALGAGCDVALHCNGNLPEMMAVADAAGPLSVQGRRRLAAALDRLPETDLNPDPLAMAARLDALMQGA